MKKILLVAGIALALAGCGEKSDFEKAINAKIGQTKSCYSLRDNNVSFPVRLAKSRTDQVGTGSVILDGAVAQGLMVFDKGWDADILSVTDEGKKAGVWSTKEGVCVGRRVVDEVKEWTEPGKNSPQIVRVTYTWKLVDIPGWVDKKEFVSVKGMAEPEEAKIVLVKTNNGWAAR